jgi:glycosyltransferase involved in cell wall biosynthesis
MGRIAESKGIDDAIEAIELARLDGAKIRFVVAGSGPAADAFSARCQRTLGPDFKFKGVVAGAAKAQTLESCDVFLLPSHFEGLPMALLESMAFGLVPITTRVGSIPTVIEDRKNGLFVDIKSPGQIAAALRALAADRAYLRILSRSARERMIEHCNVRRYVERLNEVYNRG